jgi:hypothetical protein
MLLSAKEGAALPPRHDDFFLPQSRISPDYGILIHADMLSQLSDSRQMVA